MKIVHVLFYTYLVIVKTPLKKIGRFQSIKYWSKFAAIQSQLPQFCFKNWNDPNHEANPRNEEAARQEVGNLNNKANLTSKTFVKGGLLPTLAKLMIVMWRLIEGQMEWVSMIIRIRVLDDSMYKLQ